MSGHLNLTFLTICSTWSRTQNKMAEPQASLQQLSEDFKTLQSGEFCQPSSQLSSADVMSRAANCNPVETKTRDPAGGKPRRSEGEHVVCHERHPSKLCVTDDASRRSLGSSRMARPSTSSLAPCLSSRTEQMQRPQSRGDLTLYQPRCKCNNPSEPKVSAHHD